MYAGKYAFAYLNYPNQLFRSVLLIPNWENPKDRNEENNILISSYEVLRRRTKRGQRCIPNSNPYDDFILRQEIEKVGCRAPYHVSEDPFPICERPEELKVLADLEYKLSDNSLLPCQEMTSLYYKNVDEEKGLALGNRFAMFYPKNIKLITQSRAIDYHSLIGNIGGYIGLFLGTVNNCRYK